MISDDPINSCVPHLMSLEYFFFSSDYFTLNHGKTLENGANVKNSTLLLVINSHFLMKFIHIFMKLT